MSPKQHLNEFTETQMHTLKLDMIFARDWWLLFDVIKCLKASSNTIVIYEEPSNWRVFFFQVMMLGK